MGMFADRMSQVSVSATLKVAAEAERLRRAGHSVVDFSAGEPDFPTPEHVKAAAKAAIDANFTRYTAAAGIPELREAICARYKARLRRGHHRRPKCCSRSAASRRSSTRRWRFSTPATR